MQDQNLEYKRRLIDKETVIYILEKEEGKDKIYF